MREILDKPSLESAMAKAGFLGRLHFLDKTESTNSHSMRLLANGASAPFATVAAEQTAGRGRLSRKWFSEKDSTLCISVAVELPNIAELVQSFTVRAGIEICESLCARFGSKIFLKWPNDIYSERGGKIGGMLTGLFLSKDGRKIAVFGVGLNCLPRLNDSEIPADVRNSMENLAGVSRKNVGLSEAAAIVAKAAETAAAQTSTNGTAERYAKIDWLKGKKINLDVGDKTLSGIAEGVDDWGRIGLSAEGCPASYFAAIEAILKK